jgi:hypothetical protein
MGQSAAVTTPAGLVRRAIGYAIDLLLLSAPLSVVLALHLGPLVAAAVVAAYEVVLIGGRGQTIGSAAVGVAVLTDGIPPGFGRAAVRWVVPVLVGQVAVLFTRHAMGPWPGVLVGYVVVYGPSFLDPLRRALHDRLAGTQALLLIPGVPPTQ